MLSLFYLFLDKIPGTHDEAYLCRILVNMSIVGRRDLSIFHHSFMVDFQSSNPSFVLFNVVNNHAENYEYGLDSKTEDKIYVLQLPGYEIYNASYTYVFRASLVDI